MLHPIHVISRQGIQAQVTCPSHKKSTYTLQSGCGMFHTPDTLLYFSLRLPNLPELKKKMVRSAHFLLRTVSVFVSKSYKRCKEKAYFFTNNVNQCLFQKLNYNYKSSKEIAENWFCVTFSMTYLVAERLWKEVASPFNVAILLRQRNLSLGWEREREKSHLVASLMAFLVHKAHNQMNTNQKTKEQQIKS